MQLGLLLLCLALPLLEIAVLIKVGHLIGGWWTLLLLIGMAVAGGIIIRQQGIAAVTRIITSARQGRPPIEPMVDSMFLMLAGVLLMIPGLLTDVAGLLLLVPPIRRAFARWMFSRFSAAGAFRSTTFSTGPGPADSSPTRDSPHGPRRHESPDGHDRSGPTAHPKGSGDRGVVIEGEWERIDEPPKRPSEQPSGRPSERPGGPPKSS